jgi:hypothetical protein
MLFEMKPRTRMMPKKPGENEFAFYDSSARAEFQIYRDLINDWIDELPNAERGEIIARFQKSDSLGYQAALAELTIHAALIRQGYTVEIHPPCPHPSRRPDFLAKEKNGDPLAYIEVTTFGPAQEQVTRSNREATIYNAIDKTKLPTGFRLTYDVEKYGQNTPNIGNLCREIETWAAASQQEDPNVMPSKVFEVDDWKIEIGLIGGFRKDVVPGRSIATAFGDVRTVSPAIEIREALSKKGTRYGNFSAPYVIVVADCKNELTGGARNADSLIEAAFGTVVTQFTANGSGTPKIEDKRRNDGYFGRPGKPEHQNVSAAIVLPKPHLWDLRNDRWQPLLLRNPWAHYPLPDEVLPLPGCEYLADEDKFARKDGTRLADLLGLPAVWPPAEE